MSNDRLGGVKTLQVGGFLDEFAKDDIKNRVDIVAVFESFGVKLGKKGKSYIGLCPFHNDKNPSLSVDREKGLYNCFGCGEAGDVFNAVQAFKKCSFKEALDFLKTFDSSVPAAPLKSPEPVKPKPSPASEVVGPLKQSPEAIVQLKDMSSLSSFYRRKLSVTPKATSYLKSRGILNSALKFNAGYSDGSLSKAVNQKQKDFFIETGILKAGEREHFRGCVVIPLRDLEDNITGFYGRKVEQTNSKGHLYQQGTHRGLLNPKAYKVYPEQIVLCESVIDSLSLYEAGILQSDCCFGVNGFTVLHLKALKDNRVKEVVIAFDADDSGRKGAEKLKTELLENNIAVRVVYPEGFKDWNEALVEGKLDSKSFMKLVERVEKEVPESEAKDLEVSKTPAGYLFKVENISYRVAGVKQGFVSSLRVNIRAEREEIRFLDNADLYSAKSRISFALNCCSKFEIESRVVERHLLQIVDYLEKERDSFFEKKEEQTEVVLTDKQKAAGMKLLKDPDLFKRIVEDTETLGYVGEAVNKQLIYIAASSRKMADPVSVIVVSQSAAGKSYLIDTVRKLMPDEDVVNVTSLSDQALNYLPEEGLLHKFLILGEAVHGHVIDHQVREMLSAKELSRMVTLKNPATGRMESKVVRKKVVVSCMMSSTSNNINPENASRNFVINTDESQKQTKAIHDSQRKKYSIDRYYQKDVVIPGIIEAHHAAQRLLKQRVIVNPFAGFLDFPASMMRSRRDHERFIDLIAAVCFLRQYQKEEKVSESGTLYIECDLDDYSKAYELLTAVLPATLTNFPKSAIKVYEALRELSQSKAKDSGLKAEEISVTQRELRETSGISHDIIKRSLRLLADYEYVFQVGGKHRGQKARYFLHTDEPLQFLSLDQIPDPKEMARKWGISKT